MQIIEAFDVRVWDGGGDTNHAFYLGSKVEAEKYMANNKFDSVKPVTFVIFDSLEEQAKDAREKLRKSAYKKLNKEEREALGLNDL